MPPASAAFNVSTGQVCETFYSPDTKNVEEKMSAKQQVLIIKQD